MITYLLGAGASYNAIPVVKGMDSRIQSMFLYFEAHKQTKISQEWWNLSDEIRENYSVDTLARKLSLKGKNRELNKLKSLISAYLLWEQTVKPSDSSIPKRIQAVNNRQDAYILHTNRFNYRVKGNLRGPNSFLSFMNEEDEVLKNFDYRYESFFSAIATSPFSLNKNFNFLSWNYDNQIEIALSRIFDFESLKDPVHQNRRLHEILNDKFVKLNGSTGMSTFDFEPISGFSEEIRQANFERIWNLLSGSNITFPNRIYFAWEAAFEIDRERYLSIAESTEILVIIGYSFPQYNREIDLNLFEQLNFNKIRKIVVQDTSQNIANVVQRVRAMLSNKFKVKLEPYTDLELFYIPV